MLFVDTYKEVQSNTDVSYSIKRSKFIAYSFKVTTELEVKQSIKKIKQSTPSANHHCYAYILHPDQSIYRFNDDGEPRSTAGKQILKQIQKFQLTNTLIIVIRYFGGVKLGIPGLIKAYSVVTLSVIKKSGIIDKDIEEKYTIIFKNSEINNVMRLMKEYELKILEREFDENCKLVFLVTKTKSNIVLNRINKNHKIKLIYT